MILSHVLRGAFKQRVTIAYGGIVGRAENREMVRSLHLKLSHVRNLSWKKYERFALVDTQPRSGNNQLPRASRRTSCSTITRCAGQHAGVPFIDIRPPYGATATIVAEYLLASGVRSTHAVATALIYAIRSETQDFAREWAGPGQGDLRPLLPATRTTASWRASRARACP